MKAITAAYSVVIAATVGQAAWWHERLPERVANHFGSGGMPNGWASRDAHVLMTVGLILLMCAIFVVTPRLLRGLPPSMINIPNRDHWLAPERRDATMDRIGNELGMLGLVVTAGILAITQLVNAQNLEPQPSLPTGPFLAMLFGTIAGVLVFVVRMLVTFRVR